MNLDESVAAMMRFRETVAAQTPEWGAADNPENPIVLAIDTQRENMVVAIRLRAWLLAMKIVPLSELPAKGNA